jgi:hypothetical protein
MHRNPWSGLGSHNHTIPSTFYQPHHLRHRQSNNAHKLVGTFYQSQLLFINIFLETSPVTIDDDDFDLWVGNCLDISLGPCPGGSPQAMAGPAATGGMDYSALARMMATTVGTTMMHLNQVVAPQGGGQGISGNKTALSTGKRFDQDQVAKLKDACGVRNAQQIPAIWSVIQATKGKSFESYRAHIAKSVDAWCHSHHIDRDISNFLEAKNFKDLVALGFNPGGPVAQYQSVVQGMSMLACCLLTASKAEYCRDYEEVVASTTNTCSLEDQLKQNRGKMVAPAANYMDLKLNIGTYCRLFWTILEDHCDYYKEFLKLYRILDHEECFKIWHTYTKEVCACITWAIIDDGWSFFGRNPVAFDFAAGSIFIFLVSYLEGVMDAVRNANPIQRVSFPHEWLSPSPLDPLYSVLLVDLPPNHWGNPPTAMALAPASAPPPAPPTPKEDTQHPNIKLLMDPYLKRYNNFLNLSKILTSLGKRMTGLPSLPQYCHPTGQPFLCWNSILRKCFQGAWCRYLKGHLKKREATDAFANAISECLSKGVVYYTNLPAGASSPQSKQKGGGEPKAP